MTPTIKIAWDTLSIKDWEKRFSGLAFSNFIQSYSYARAAAPHYRQTPRWGLILVNGKEAGLVQMFETGLLWKAIHAVIIDRGPLWFEGFGGALHTKLFFDEINKLYPKRFGRKRRFLPEIEDGLTAQKLIAQTGLSPVEGRTGYETVWVDLNPSEAELRAQMKSNWRNKLNKAEKAGLQIEAASDDATIAMVASVYAADKSVRDYGGMPSALFQTYASILSSNGSILLLQAIRDGQMIAFTVLAIHGRSATYLIGWSSDTGRDCAAHHLLLWEGINSLKRNGVKELDLGGTNNDSAAGVKTFKEGLGGRTVCYLGQHA